MTFQLDPAILAAMTQEARECFLAEDAPEYLQALLMGLETKNNSPDFKLMLRAAHSLKGGAGLAQLLSIKELSHKLEDLLEGIQQRELPDLEIAWLLLEKGINEIAFLLAQAHTVAEVTADAQLLEQIEQLTQLRNTSATETETITQVDNTLVAQALKIELESQFNKIESLPLEIPGVIALECVNKFCEECIFLGETLELSWLIETIETLEQLVKQSPPEEALSLAQKSIVDLRKQKDDYLNPKPITQEAVSETSSLHPAAKNKHPLEPQALSQLRIPVERLELITNTVEEVILTQEQLRLQQQLLEQANQRLKKLASQFEPLHNQVQAVYDKLAISPLTPMAESNDSAYDQFDSLELDRYTELHSSLQTFQELMSRIQEARADLDLINFGLTEDLELVDNKLGILYSEVTKSRLVPFQVLSQRFFPQIDYLNKRYHKSVQLKISGENLLINQVLLEQLQTPLTHLLNNAFDHGIEPPAERKAKGKPQEAQIRIEAKQERNQLVLHLIDDGRGIDSTKVYNRAKEKGLCPENATLEQLDKSEILDWIFQPHFSTADKVSELSGRGVGLDIVKNQVQKLRGIINVSTQVGKGTHFVLKLPLSLSLLSLFLVEWENHTLAIPTTSILETILYSELQWINPTDKTINWHDRTLRFFSLSHLLPYYQFDNLSTVPKVVMILEGEKEPFAIAVDTLLAEKQLIVKPFDNTALTPPYLAGCTILGNSEVVPVILPQAFTLSATTSKASASVSVNNLQQTLTPTIVVVEDSVATRRLLERLLSEFGYQVVVCRDGQEALDQLKQRHEQIDLVLSDVEMPRVNGFELLEQMKNNPSWCRIPVIMITSRTGDRHQKEALQRGANAYLGKPVQHQELFVTIQQLLNQ